MAESSPDDCCLTAQQYLCDRVTHDLNNLLTALRGYTELALETSTGETSAHLEEAHRVAQRISDLVGALQLFAGTRVGRWEYLDIGSLVGEAVDCFPFPKPIEIHSRIATNLPGCLAIRDHLEQTIRALLTNAVEAMPQGGMCQIRLYAHDVAVARANPRLAAGRYLVLAIEDSGGGIEPRLLPRVYQPFVTTTPGTRGKGLGLAVAYGIAQAHGGGLEIQSTLGKGTIVRLYLPIESVDGA
ncbi:HAMP domain-containing histidine kinase [Candidatus Berkelbacteria bacterium]|nr:HAMP domain-containing histidine kinase [Candidatus Berkelbacteria bacterium]